MSTRNVQNGTPVSGDWLCRTCTYAHIQRGDAESQEAFFCAFRGLGRPRRLEFKVRQCNSYQDAQHPSLYHMEKTAWILVTKQAGRTVGFVTQSEFKKIEGEDAEVLP